MTEDAPIAADTLRDVRNRLAKPSAPLRVDLREYLSPKSAAWKAFVSLRGKPPGYNVKQRTMLRWLDEVIAKLEGAVLEFEGTEDADKASAGTQLRRLTPDGIDRAGEFLAGLRQSPDGEREPPRDLLYDERFSRPFGERVQVEPRTFSTRRELGEYLSQTLGPVKHVVADDPGVWSWLGMYYFANVVRVKDGRVQLHTDESVLFLGGRFQQRRYRHYLWFSWRIYEQLGEQAGFLLNQSPTTRGDLVEAIGGYARIFNSKGVVPLILRLYTDGEKTRVGFSAKKGRPGNLRRLPSALDQLELTYDVYGMEPDALLKVLPPVFRKWDLNSSKA
ncbi:MAG: hypothetical protein OXG61_08195 [Chloroflexi bacterium]|nr:hypothetical protein [Chloroflexota bacterium]